MSLDSCFQVSEKERTVFIDDSIIKCLPEDVKNFAKTRATKIIENYVGRDKDALSVLAYAAEKGRFYEFAEKLDKHFKENLQHVHPEARKLAKIPGAVRAEKFFLECYESLGIKPSKK